MFFRFDPSKSEIICHHFLDILTFIISSPGTYGIDFIPVIDGIQGTLVSVDDVEDMSKDSQNIKNQTLAKEIPEQITQFYVYL